MNDEQKKTATIKLAEHGKDIVFIMKVTGATVDEVNRIIEEGA